jgi:hypothetical protein
LLVELPLLPPPHPPPPPPLPLLPPPQLLPQPPVTTINSSSVSSRILYFPQRWLIECKPAPGRDYNRHFPKHLADFTVWIPAPAVNGN